MCSILFCRSGSSVIRNAVVQFVSRYVTPLSGVERIAGREKTNPLIPSFFYLLTEYLLSEWRWDIYLATNIHTVPLCFLTHQSTPLPGSLLYTGGSERRHKKDCSRIFKGWCWPKEQPHLLLASFSASEWTPSWQSLFLSPSLFFFYVLLRIGDTEILGFACTPSNLREWVYLHGRILCVGVMDWIPHQTKKTRLYCMKKCALQEPLQGWGHPAQG